MKFLLISIWAITAWAQNNALFCKPQVGLPLSQPYPPAYFQTLRLPACSQYTCSCCNLTHALAIHRALSAAREDPTFSRTCLSWHTRMSCRVCDPEVGVGIKPTVCRGVCDQWWSACRDEYFTFESTSLSAFDPQLLPCAAPTARQEAAAAVAAAGAAAAAAVAAAAGPLLCSRLRDVVQDGEGLCREAGYEVAAAGETSCFDGSASYSTDFCVRPPPSQPSASQQGRRRRQQRRGAGAGGTEEEEGEEPLSPAVYFVAAVVILSLAWLGYTTKLGVKASEEAVMQKLHYRQLQRRD
ncbi:hypothetical protein VOLCADRAFT_90464 [Volvox carteri f. nagariensis]|uniref:Folate receptor-like domain-containing protein n=1 Tax=Volvox carteri f. nagariensis TaxID=3068 RepID=D8TUG0_VOLCA|nr:uncharacterized protein VOLCADRAFT_90464 [Volvox carteri f. nagariensis]EFJ48818.1 hypothetical protein VOLCADRAFT_90464 [Volvox carteri f. nagariensis]|eukprot:XP_002950150.1 hypothetical protein VOLCADRAFT_90464 [Volvox carteri f. nagariensis]